MLFALLRLTMNRSPSTVGMTDLLVIVLIADAAQNAMAADYAWLGPNGMLLVGTIVAWRTRAFDWLAYRYPETIGRLVHPKPREQLVRGRAALTGATSPAELISDDELMTQLRLQGRARTCPRSRSPRNGGQMARSAS